MKLVLGSSSTFRARILEEHGFQFDVIKPGIDEKAIRSDAPWELALEIGKAKAQAVAKRFAPGDKVVIICSDQVISCGGQIFEKPISKTGMPDTSTVMMHLISYARNPAVAYTSVVVHNMETGEEYSGVDVTTVHFEKFTQDQMKLIAAEGWTYKAAGSLPTGIIESPAAQLIESKIRKYEGDKTGFQGLPIPMLQRLLNEAGYTRS